MSANGKDPKKILFVNDEERFCRTASAELRDAGYDVVVARDGEEALEEVYARRPDLIILDIMLPKIEGCHVCVVLKGNKRYADIPIIIMAVSIREEEMKRPQELGPDAYIIKPFEMSALIEKVEELLDEAECDSV